MCNVSRKTLEILNEHHETYILIYIRNVSHAVICALECQKKTSNKWGPNVQ